MAQNRSLDIEAVLSSTNPAARNFPPQICFCSWPDEIGLFSLRTIERAAILHSDNADSLSWPKESRLRGWNLPCWNRRRKSL